MIFTEKIENKLLQFRMELQQLNNIGSLILRCCFTTLSYLLDENKFHFRH
jgi:hypothetical protein